MHAALLDWLSNPDRLGPAGAVAWLDARDAPTTTPPGCWCPSKVRCCKARQPRRALTRPAAEPLTYFDIPLAVREAGKREAEQLARWDCAENIARRHADMDANSQRIAREYKAQLEQARNRKKKAAWCRAALSGLALAVSAHIVLRL